VDETSELIVKPMAQPCKQSKQQHYETFVIDNGEWITLFVGAQTNQTFF
jgi:hypothetical protein